MASESPSLEVIWRLHDYIVKEHRWYIDQSATIKLSRTVLSGSKACGTYSDLSLDFGFIGDCNHESCTAKTMVPHVTCNNLLALYFLASASFSTQQSVVKVPDASRTIGYHTPSS
jgi:hypothetical protein